MKNRHSIGEILGLANLVSRNDNRTPLVPELFDFVPYLPLTPQIDLTRRLVEYRQLRPLNQYLGRLKPLRLSSGQVHEHLIPRLPQLQVLHRLLNQVLPLRGFNIKHGRVELENRRRFVSPEASGFLKRNPHDLAHLVPSSTTSSPITFTVPPDGLRIVQSIIRRVVVPDPFGPRITIISPGSTLKSRPWRASVLPYFLIRLRVSTAYKWDRSRRRARDKNVQPEHGKQRPTAGLHSRLSANREFLAEY